MLDKWIIYRLVFADLGSLNEIETKWTFKDIMEGNEILNIKEDIEFVSLPKPPKKPKGKV